MFALLVLLSCAPVYARSAKTQYKVKVKISSGSFEAAAGSSLELTLNDDSIMVSGKTCPRATENHGNRYVGCPVHEEIVSAQFPPSAISGVVHGQTVNFIGIIWNLNGKQAILAVEPSERESSLIIDFLEKVTGKKSVNADTQVTDAPRVLLGSNSYGPNLASSRDQSMEMARDLKDACPIVRVTINEQKADFTVRLNHIEKGLIIRDNQVEVYNKDGDLISGIEGGSIMDGVKNACALIVTEWAAYRE
jgi:hypothetical protein